jgi:hypothetical protein
MSTYLTVLNNKENINVSNINNGNKKISLL